ncbi:hypothetical protein ACTWPF_15270 [Oceanobacillus sp. M65]|uniref:Uncharacterized protein n=1 Tax=Oceanobacillus jordanicus TaxID=2867266 RepID=A0AAW5B995_9BACI|nr:hypothetical protein [Oceanobacillus jordanicus]MCG3421209.1 hypothetical protein [Oceanobacillus jordanicus]
MELHKISLMDAYMIETLRSNGISDKEILTQIEQGKTEAWQELNRNFDFQELVKFAEKDMEGFKRILSQGYRVKFVTFNGLKNLLRLRFGKERETDYELTETGIRNLNLNSEQLVDLKQVLSGNWVVEELDDTNNLVVNIERS